MESSFALSEVFLAPSVDVLSSYRGRGEGGGPRIFCPYLLAAASSCSSEGIPTDFGGSLRALAGSPSSSKKDSSPGGAIMVRNVASLESTMNACSVPDGTKRKSPSEARTFLLSSTKVMLTLKM